MALANIDAFLKWLSDLEPFRNDLYVSENRIISMLLRGVKSSDFIRKILEEHPDLDMTLVAQHVRKYWEAIADERHQSSILNTLPEDFEDVQFATLLQREKVIALNHAVSELCNVLHQPVPQPNHDITEAREERSRNDDNDITKRVRAMFEDHEWKKPATLKRSNAFMRRDDESEISENPQ